LNAWCTLDPDSLPSTRWDAGELPAGWRKAIAVPDLQAGGEAWIRAGPTGILLVPSVIVPSEMNVLLDPAHPDFAKVRVTGRTPFHPDPRLLP